jgi:hypothetical protein
LVEAGVGGGERGQTIVGKFRETGRAASFPRSALSGRIFCALRGSENGTYAEQQQSFNDLPFVPVRTLVLIFLVLLFEFRSFSFPGAILTLMVLSLLITLSIPFYSRDTAAPQLDQYYFGDFLESCDSPLRFTSLFALSGATSFARP